MYPTGPRIQQIREEAGLSKVEFARKVGISNTFGREIELGAKMPGGEIIMRICECFKKSSDWLLFGVDSKAPFHTIAESTAPYGTAPCRELQNKVIVLEKEVGFLRGKVEAYERVLGDLPQGERAPPANWVKRRKSTD